MKKDAKIEKLKTTESFWIAFLCMMILIIPCCVTCSFAQATELKLIDYFSTNYKEACNKFLEAAQASGATIESFRNPHTGPHGEALYMDVAAIGPKSAKDILVLGSGTHGVEGFAGSGIQIGLLREGIASALKPNVRIIMIHAINPYGFAHLRRTNEDNVDLNRNFIAHTKPYPKSDGYLELADVISPKSISFWENTKLRLKFLWYRLKNGKAALKGAVSEGQYTHSKGLFFGGQKKTWSNKTLREIARRYLSNAHKVIFIDFHTGLGPYGNAEVIMNVNANDPAYKRAVQWWGDRVKTTVSRESHSVHIQGSLKLAIPKMVPHAEVTAVSLEFGTYPAKEVFWALRAENWLHHYGGENHPNAKTIKSELLKVFYPYTEEWKLKVWQQGKEIVNQALLSINSLQYYGGRKPKRAIRIFTFLNIPIV
jgi:hypothetical protein